MRVAPLSRLVVRVAPLCVIPQKVSPLGPLESGVVSPAAAAARAAERREQEFRSAAKAAELRSLRYQVNPHFLFNTLNSLSALVGAMKLPTTTPTRNRWISQKTIA